ncbi:MAG TPA: M48 family metallopeptidase [Gemmatimonadales bacterium]|nr:M48 family metallopeptidase [Gemmatimonadales bacterium]
MTADAEAHDGGRAGRPALGVEGRRVVAALAIVAALAGGLVVAVAPTRPSGPAVATAADSVAVPPPSEAALRYHRSGNVLWIVGTLLALAVPALLLLSGASARLRTLAWRIGRRWYPALAVHVALLFVTIALLELPFAFYVGFLRERAYGRSHQSLGAWAADGAIALGLGIVGTALTVWLPYRLIRRSPRRWWLLAGAASLPFILLVQFVAPLWIEPLFNRIRPVGDRGLEAEILALARRAGLERPRVYVVEKSADTETVNAYVSGVGGTQRIVVWDTLLRKLDRDEALAVLGHEIGHYVLGHVRTGLWLGTLLVLLALYGVHRAAGRIIARWRHRLRFDRLDDFASLPLLMLLAQLALLLVQPAVLAVSRRQEREADRFALELTRDNRALARAFVKLQAENLAVPDPGWLHTVWRGSHPPLGDRIRFANRYRPWARGEPLRYDHLFRSP